MPSDAITIRPARPGDAEDLARIGRDTFVETFAHLYPPEDLETFLVQAYDVSKTRTALEDPDQASWLVEADDQLIGYASVGPCGLPHPDVTDGSWEVKRIYFLKPWQGAGLGGRLFDQAVSWILARRPKDIWIGVWSENFGAQKFYARRGYTHVGTYGFKVGRVVDHEFILRQTI